ncbi:MAG: response regulator [Allosphingosinicella sp.]
MLRVLRLRYLGLAAAGWLLATSALLVALLADLSVGAAIALSLLLLPAALIGAYRLSTSAARQIAVPADALLRVLPADDQRRLVDTAGETATADENLPGERLKALADAIMRRISRGATQISDLVRARDDAETANLAKSHFLANMSHQLRTPLNAIVGYATLLQEDAIAAARAEQVSDLGRVLQASRNLLELINDMLDLSKIEVGKTTFQRSIVDINSLTKSITASFDLAQQGNANTLAVFVQDEIGIMIGDAGKLRQCLLNLVGNALKFTSEGEVRLKVSAVERDSAETIEFMVADTGIGMSPAEAANLFRDTAVDATESAASGARLGLAITHRLATMMGGSVSVRSAPGKGSVFTLTVPREMPRSVPAEDILPFIQRGNDLAATAEKKALVIDDDPLARDLMRRWLSRLGYSILTAETGEAGFELAREHKPNVIILDVLMPGIDGYQVLEMLRADKELSTIPVVIVSVCDDRSAALKAGACEALTKPVQPKALEQVLDVYCKQMKGEVLVIEDDPDSGTLIQRTAAQVGLKARVARNGEEGLELIRRRPPAAIVLDLNLPGMSGFQVLDALQADDRLKHIPVLIVSGQDISSQQHQAIERSGGVFHSKGTSPREIAQSLRMAVSR